MKKVSFFRVFSILCSSMFLITCSALIEVDNNDDSKESNSIDASVTSNDDSGKANINGSNDSDIIDNTISEVKINEVIARSDTESDWIEFYNPGKVSVDLSEWIIKDNDDSHIYFIPDGTILEKGSYLTIKRDDSGMTGFGFGLGKKDAVRLFDANNQMVDSTGEIGQPEIRLTIPSKNSILNENLSQQGGCDDVITRDPDFFGNDSILALCEPLCAAGVLVRERSGQWKGLESPEAVGAGIHPVFVDGFFDSDLRLRDHEQSLLS